MQSKFKMNVWLVLFVSSLINTPWKQEARARRVQLVERAKCTEVEKEEERRETDMVKLTGCNTHVCLGFYHGFYLLIGACFSSGLYLQLLILKNGRGIMVNPPII